MSLREDIIMACGKHEWDRFQAEIERQAGEIAIELMKKRRIYKGEHLAEE